MTNFCIASDYHRVRIGTKGYVENTTYKIFCIKAMTEQQFQSILHRAGMEETKEDIAYLLYSMLEEQ